MSFFALPLLILALSTLAAALVRVQDIERSERLRARIQGTPVPSRVRVTVCETISPGR